MSYYEETIRLTGAQIVKKDDSTYLEIVAEDDRNILTIPRIALDRAELIVLGKGPWRNTQTVQIRFEVFNHGKEGAYSIEQKTKKVTQREIEEELGYPIEIIKE